MERGSFYTRIVGQGIEAGWITDEHEVPEALFVFPRSFMEIVLALAQEHSSAQKRASRATALGIGAVVVAAMSPLWPAINAEDTLQRQLNIGCLLAAVCLCGHESGAWDRLGLCAGVETSEAVMRAGLLACERVAPVVDGLTADNEKDMRRVWREAWTKLNEPEDLAFGSRAIEELVAGFQSIGNAAFGGKDMRVGKH